MIVIVEERRQRPWLVLRYYIFIWRLSKTTISESIAGILAKIRNGYLPNSKQEC